MGETVRMEQVMPFYKDHVYPYLVSALGNPKPIEDIRRRIVPLAQGIVLEIGVGPGVNFVHYDPAKVNKVMVEVLHEIEPGARPTVIRESAAALKSGGWMLIVDWA